MAGKKLTAKQELAIRSKSIEGLTAELARMNRKYEALVLFIRDQELSQKQGPA